MGFLSIGRGQSPYAGSRPSRQRSNGTDHLNVLTLGFVLEQIKVMLLSTVFHLSRKLIPSSNGTLTIMCCLFYNTETT